MTYDMNHNDRKRDNGRRDNESSTRRRHTTCGRLLRMLLLLVTMTVEGATEAWADDDFTGIWYIANETNHADANITTHWYLVPGRDPQQPHYADAYFNNQYCNASGSGDYTGDNYGDTGKPFLTTYQTSQDLNSVWIVVSTSDGYYNIIHARTGKYVVYEPPYKDEKKRKSVHLETITGNPGDNAKFTITGSLNGPININPKSVTSGDMFFNPAVGVGNRAQYYGTGTFYHEGMIGLYSGSGDKSQWYLEKASPIITFAADGKVQINSSVPSSISSTIYYRTDDTDPTTTDAQYTSEFTPDEDATCVKAIVVINGVQSNVACVPVLPGSAHTFLLQSLGYTSAIPHDGFFLQPGDVDNSGNITVTTSSVARPLMQWYLELAGNDSDHQYYHFVNPESGNYLYCDAGGNVWMKTSTDFDAESDDYKFHLQTDASSGYRIVPKALPTKWINKAYGHNLINAVNTSDNVTDLSCRWEFILSFDHKMPTALRPTPFSVSNSDSATYYKIVNASATDYFIVPGDNVTTSSDTEREDMAWLFKEAESDDWLTYYHIVNAKTGMYMFFNGNETSTGNDNAFITKGISTTDKDRYQFVIAKTQTSATEGKYYIVPKVLKDLTYTNYSLVRRDGTNNLKTQAQRKDDDRKWTFTKTSLFCNDPVFKETDGNISISCIPDITKIYYTTDGSTPTASSTSLYSGTTWPSSSSLRLKAFAVVSNDSESASSEVFTLFNNPDITLKEGGIEVTDATYTYDGTAHKPDVTVSVSTGGDGTTIVESSKYNVAYSDSINAGTTAAVTVTDKGTDDHLQIWNIAPKYFTINPAPLTVAANDYTIGYGDEPDNDSVAYSGFVNSETITALGGTLSYSYNTASDGTGTAYTSYVSPTGTYYIIPTGLTSTNYAITFIPGELTVEKKSIGEGTLAPGFTLSFDENNSIVLKQGTITLVENTDFTVATTSTTSKYSTRTVSGDGNYTGSFDIKNAIAHFTSDGSAGATEYSATFVAESAGAGDIGHALPDGVTAYIITGIEGYYANAEPLDYIPEGVPVLLLANEEKNGFVVEDANSGDVTEVTQTQKDNNMLEEVTDNPSKHFNTREIYLLYMNEFVHNMEGNLAKGKVYLNPNHSSGGGGGGGNSRLQIRWDTETGIDDSHLSPLPPHLSGPWYTLDGRRLSGRPTQKGLYLCNGQKMVVR